MKTSIKTLGIAALTSLVSIIAFSGSASANEKITLLNKIGKFNKLTVSGNVDVLIVQSPESRVTVYDDYYAKNALVQEKNGELRISSFEKKPLSVVVYTNQLTEINASDQATVNTQSVFKTICLEVNLKNEAKANLNTSTLDLFAQLDNDANLELSGDAVDYNVVMNDNTSIKTDKFKSDNTSISAKKTVIAQKAAPLSLEDLKF